MRRSSSKNPVIINSGQPAASQSQRLEGSYRMVRLLGRGTMSSVYLAEQLSMARPVALKILSPNLAKNPAFVQRFLHEARAAARLNHPNIVSAIDFGEIDSRFFLTMEFVDGEALNAMLSREGALEEKRVLVIGMQVISALEHAAKHNVVHLDVKPANIMICKDGRVKLTDFGLALLLDPDGAVSSSQKAAGTPYYMAPEQVEGGKVDWRTDQFSLGASLYEAVTGQKPFQGASVSDILVKRFYEKPVPAWKAGKRKVSRGFSAVLAKMLARAPESRYQSFSDLQKDFSRLMVDKKPAVAKMSSTTTIIAPSASTTWDAMGAGSVVRRVDDMLWRRRWNWFIYAALIFLAFMGIYSVTHAKMIMGPKPPPLVRMDVVNEAENLPTNKSRPLRRDWESATLMLMRAEREPTAFNINQALVRFRILTKNREYKDTAYSRAAMRKIEYLESELERIGKQARAAVMVEPDAPAGREESP